ncbi:hypothetical protein LTR56_025871 [Elasticomyces elasticus]|nr:hypothetical protein LTR56_025871 [Elasticomyces elasticus]KAK3630853.1 hypothetical protein LTR22_021305 [Elasticomyces elasticus]KAK4909257.1 hypothetical protein LTR49_021927 [Elasticomyces elasticus]KAK5753535.1 hypothetical protein LTS12_016375 [Elasticomyces elasticus]
MASIRVTRSREPMQQKVERPPRVLVCPSGFKESLQPHVVADCIEKGILVACAHARVIKAPLVDGGEGTTEALVAATGGQLYPVEVLGPTRQPVQSCFGIIGGQAKKTAVIEMAAAAGLSLVPRDQRNPLNTTTFGVGQLIVAALNAGAEHILVGCGDSGTCDGGVGMAQALGARFLNGDGTRILDASGALPLAGLASIDLIGLDPRLATVPIDVACNWHNVLCGSRGVARVFGPQKGATLEDVLKLESAMEKVAAVCSTYLGRDISTEPGSGASGGLGAGLLLLGATLHSRFDIIFRFLAIEALIADCDIVFTAEGSLDDQTPRGKIPAEVARMARRYQVPVIALAGTIGRGADTNYKTGIRAFMSICSRPVSLEKAILEAEHLLAKAAESSMRMVMVGQGFDLEKILRAFGGI